MSNRLDVLEELVGWCACGQMANFGNGHACPRLLSNSLYLIEVECSTLFSQLHVIYNAMGLMSSYL